MKKMKIAIRGAIVDSWYDGDWAQKYIEQGLWTPLSYVKKQLAEAEKAGAEIEIFISSQGGCVMSGNDILGAIQAYPHAKSITVGAFAASMAANIALQAGCPVKAHKNSIFLFHGAWSITMGGKGAHEDEAKILNQINEPIKEALAAKGVPADVIEQGFQDDRQFTMTAKEAAEYGIISEIIGDVAPPPAKMDKEAEAALVEQGSTIDIAAFSAWENADPEPTATEQIGTLKAALQSAKTQASAIQSSADKRIAALLADHKTEIEQFTAKYETIEAEYTAFKEESERLQAESTEKISQITSELKKVEAAHAQLSGQALIGGDGGENNISSWSDAVEKFGLIEAQKLFPDLASQHKTNHKKR